VSDLILRCPLIPEAEPKLHSIGLYWEVEAKSESGIYVSGPAWMDKARAIREWNEAMVNYPGSQP